MVPSCGPLHEINTSQFLTTTKHLILGHITQILRKKINTKKKFPREQFQTKRFKIFKLPKYREKYVTYLNLYRKFDTIRAKR